MSLKIRDDSKNYTATVIKLPAKESVPGLDNLVNVNVFGNNCLIGKDSPEDELYLFFPSGTQLSKEFLHGNNLYRESQLNADLSQKGFFELNGRVKVIKFRGIISSGFVVPISSIKNAFINGIDKDWTEGTLSQLKEGNEFNEIDYLEICRKYIIPSNTPGQPGKGDRASKINNKLVELMVPNQFRFHDETNHLGNNLHKFDLDEVIVISDKWHGSSCILAKVLIAKKLNYWQKFLNLLGGEISDKGYGYIYSSGKPKSNLPKGIEGAWTNTNGDYYTSNIWKRAFDDYKESLEDGITLYGELVGFTDGGSFIQKNYDYGCSPIGKDTVVFFDGEYKKSYRFLVYRITYTKPTGETIEFSWQQIKDYCKKYKLEHVKELYHGNLRNWIEKHIPEFPDNSTAPIDQPAKAFFDRLQYCYSLEQLCINCKERVPAEGVVVRIDGKQQYNAFKLKSKLFLKKESDDLDKGETNIEDQQ